MASEDSFVDTSSPTPNESQTQNQTRPISLSMLMPLLLNLASQNQTHRQEPEPEPESESDPDPDSRSGFRVLIFDSRTGSVVMMEGTGNIDHLFENLSSKSGVSPASKASIEAMPRVLIDDGDAECAICLEMYEVGSEAREMPCTHRFHSGCIEKWLGIHGSCPMCRFVMPTEKRESNAREGRGGGEDGGDSVEEVLTVRVWLPNRNSESSDPMDVNVDVDTGSGGEWRYVNQSQQERNESDGAHDSTSTAPDFN